MQQRLHGASFLWETLQRLACGRWTESAPLGFSPVLFETLHALKLVSVSFSLWPRQPQSHAAPCTAPGAAAPLCTSLCAISQLSPGSALGLWPQLPYGSGKQSNALPRGKALLCQCPFTDRDTEPWAG